MSQQRDVIEHKEPNQILEELFRPVLSPQDKQTPAGLPMKDRKLPASFFQQPGRGINSACHSRESSTDNTASSGASYTNPPPPLAPSQQKLNNRSALIQRHTTTGGGLVINHPRAHSSPASLQETYSVANNNIVHAQHMRQHSYDILTDEVPLPPGWQMAKTENGRPYFLNHLTQSTTWEDPRKKTSISPLSNTSSNNTAGLTSPVLSLQELGPLPDGFEQATTPEGEIYFIDHKTRSTTWFDPRIPTHLQQLPPLVPVSTQATQLQQQHLPQFAALQSQAASTAASTTATATLRSQIAQQALHFQNLQNLRMETEKMKSRQREILQHQESAFGNPLLNEMMMRHSLRDDVTVAKSPTNTAADVQAIDPLLCGSSTDYHSRQESADSGLGLGTNYSLPNTPEDYLVSMDESGEANLADEIASELNLDSIQSCSALDFATENMDSDDLVPSLREELNADILSDVEALLDANKDSMMKWL